MPYARTTFLSEREEETMSAGTRLRTLALIVILSVAFICLAASVHAATSGTGTRPNIIVIMTDDQDTATMSRLQNVKSLLVDEGITYKTNIVTYSKCCPSRASFITGQYPHNTGVEANSLPLGSYAKLDNSNTLPLWLQNYGYYTGHIGKYLNHYGEQDTNLTDDLEAWQEIPAGYSEWYGTLDPGTYNYYNYSMNENGRFVQYGNDPDDYQTDVLAAKATDFIRRRANSTDGKPFFLIVTPLAPHHDTTQPLGPTPSPKYEGRFSYVSLPKPPGFNEADMSDKPAFMQQLPLLTNDNVRDMTTWYQHRLETLMSVDDMVGGVVNTLQDTGQLKNTYIIYTSDNGWIQGEHRVIYGKEFAYEPSIRVPLVIRGPNITKGRIVKDLVANIDLAPTIVELSGATPLKTMDGISLVPLFTGGELPQRSGVEIECRDIFGPPRGISPRGVSPLGDAEGGMEPENGLPTLDFYAIRTGQYMYVKYTSGDEELYDLRIDPYELRSVAADPLYINIKNNLIADLNRLKSCSGKSCL